ncbi:MAG: hypothetical protein KAX40_02535 [Herpetosiphon sp.]|nr:hypothetical protein [Herpetosiphon sp.]
MQPPAAMTAVVYWLESFDPHAAQAVRTVLANYERQRRAGVPQPSRETCVWAYLGETHGMNLLNQAQTVYRHASARFQAWNNRRRQYETLLRRFETDIHRWGEHDSRTQRTRSRLEHLQVQMMV